MQSAAWVNFPSRVLENATGLRQVGTIKYLNKVSTSSEVRMFVSTTLTANSPTFITGKRKAFIISVSAEDSSLIGTSFRVQPPPPPPNQSPKGYNSHAICHRITLWLSRDGFQELTEHTFAKKGYKRY